MSDFSILLFATLWPAIGMGGSLFWWFHEYHTFDDSDVAAFVGAILGPLAWLAGFLIHYQADYD